MQTIGQQLIIAAIVVSRRKTGAGVDRGVEE